MQACSLYGLVNLPAKRDSHMDYRFRRKYVREDISQIWPLGVTGRDIKHKWFRNANELVYLYDLITKMDEISYDRELLGSRCLLRTRTERAKSRVPQALNKKNELVGKHFINTRYRLGVYPCLRFSGVRAPR
jgi:hypothetical protein